MENPPLNFITWNINPEIFTVPFIGHPVRWYGLFWAIGLLLSYRVMSKFFKEESKPIELLDRLSLYVIIGTVLGARIGHVIFYDPDYYLAHPVEIFAIWHGGLASHGGGMGILFALLLFARKEKLDFLWLADRVALVVPLAGAFIRLGNLMNSEMVGTPTDVPWAFIFTHYDMQPRHPAQLYEAIFCFTLFFVLMKVRRLPFYKTNGKIFGLLLILLFLFRFLDEFLKINQESFEDQLALNMGQYLSIPFILIGIIFLFSTDKKLKKGAKTFL